MFRFSGRKTFIQALQSAPRAGGGGGGGARPFPAAAAHVGASQRLALHGSRSATYPIVSRGIGQQMRWYSSPMDKIDKEAEAAIAKRKITPHPERVSSTSSIHPVFGEIVETGSEAQKEPDMMAGLKHDVNTVKDTFNIKTAPREAYILGLSGVLPYLGTSLTTVYCAWELNHASGKIGFLLSPSTAESVLAFLEPIQVGYGAVIVSFLGAIHWGLEFAGYGGTQGYKRYAIGVAAPVLAWPTIFMPVEYALITQFAAFTGLYYADSRASSRGWAPQWYGTYRFVLTFIVGASIIVSLAGRGEVKGRYTDIPGPEARLTKFKDNAETALADEERARVAKLAQKQKKEAAKKPETTDNRSEDKGEDDENKDQNEGDEKESDEKDDEKEGQDEKEDDDEKKDGKGKDDKKKGDKKSEDKKDGNGDEEKADAKDDDKKADDKETGDKKADDKKADDKGEKKDGSKDNQKDDKKADDKDSKKDGEKKDGGKKDKGDSKK